MFYILEPCIVLFLIQCINLKKKKFQLFLNTWKENFKMKGYQVIGGEE